MKLILTMVLLAGVVGTAVAAEKTVTPQQQRMTTCNQQAGSQALKGDSRKAFMSSCLKGQQPAVANAKTLTPQQQKMKNCNAEAGKQSLSGAERKTFMSSCLKKK